MRRLSALALLTFTVACGRGAAPQLPPEDSMTVDFSDFDEKGALVDSTKKTHFTNAAVRVGLLNAWVGLGLFWPVVSFKAAFTQQARFVDGKWTWSYKVAGGAATCTLTADDVGAATKWEMRLNGKINGIQHDDFLWYEGTHQPGKGTWTFHSKDGKRIDLDWTVSGPTQKKLAFHNPQTNDELEYAIEGDAAGVTYAIGGKTAEIEWSRATKAGSLTASDFEGHANERACWNEQRFDAECATQ